MQKVRDFFKLPKVLGDFGVEVECEGNQLAFVDNLYWITKEDGSLRPRGNMSKACEYVLKKPIPLKSAVKAIENLADENKKNEAEFNFSFRTSVHVHVNVQEFTLEQLKNLVYVYFLLEEPLLHYSGKDRKCNRFCLRLQDAEGVLENAMNLFKNGFTSISILNEDNSKYSSMNLVPIRTQGSVEFRSMRGTLDVDVLCGWVTALHAMREYAVNKKNVLEILQEYEELGAVRFVEKVLQDISPVFQYFRLEKDVQRSFCLSMDLPAVHKWMAENPKVEVEPEEARKEPPNWRIRRLAPALEPVFAVDPFVQVEVGRVEED